MINTVKDSFWPIRLLIACKAVNSNTFIVSQLPISLDGT